MGIILKTENNIQRASIHKVSIIAVWILLVTVGMSRADIEESLRQWKSGDQAILKSIDNLLDGGSVSYQFDIFKGKNLLVLAKNRSIPNTSAQQVILVANEESFKEHLIVEPKSQLEFNILRVITQSETHMQPSSNEKRMLDILRKLIEDRSSPWPWRSPGTPKKQESQKGSVL